MTREWPLRAGLVGMVINAGDIGGMKDSLIIDIFSDLGSPLGS